MFVYLLLEVELLKPTDSLILGSPYTIYHILDCKCEVCLAVPGISERHIRRVGLRNRC